MKLAKAEVCRILAATFIILLFALTSAGQTKTSREPENPFTAAMRDNPGLLREIGQLVEKLKAGVQFPPVRYQSNLLPLISPSTTYVVAIPNYGESAHQALTIFNQQLSESPVLRRWWQSGDMAKNGPEVIRFVERFSEMSQYLGDEIVLAGETEGSGKNLIMVAQVRKPGFKTALLRMLNDVPNPSKTNVRVLELEELVAAKSPAKPSDLVVLVRPDFVVAGPDLDAVRRFNGMLEAKHNEFLTTPFGERVAKAYQTGTSMLAAGDLHSFLKLIPPGTAANQESLLRSGFGDVKYLVWDSKRTNNQTLSETEVSFMGPRHGAAAWLAPSGPLGSLDFISPKSAVVLTLGLKNLADIFDDVKNLATSSNPNAFATLPSMEQQMHINLKDDVLRLLQGEITIALKEFPGPQPEWNAVLRVNDADHLQNTLTKLLSSAPVQQSDFEEEGVRYHAVTVPSPQKPVQVVYSFVDGYLVAGSSRASATAAVGLHKSGQSLAKSAKFLQSVPPGYSPQASGLLYEDVAAMMAFQARMLAPEMASAISQSATELPPVTFFAYGEDSAIRVATSSAGADPAFILVVAAIAVPSALGARVAADESSAIGMLRAVDVAQITYSVAYPNRGYARELATLGPDPRGGDVNSANHANLIDATLGNPSCKAGAWCSKSGYRFTMLAACGQRLCKDFVVVGTPESVNTGRRSFCSTSDGVIRFRLNEAAELTMTPSECQKWSPVQ